MPQQNIFIWLQTWYAIIFLRIIFIEQAVKLSEDQIKGKSNQYTSTIDMTIVQFY